MQAVRVVLDAKLLRAADQAAKRQKVNRSALIREALEGHLKRLRFREMEEQDRRGYERHPQHVDELRDLEEVTVWPED